MTAGFPALAQLRCPACGRAFARRDGSLVCESGHCYDVARKGFVNLAPNRRQDAVYGRALFESRRRVLESGAYASVVQTLSRLCKAHAPNRALLVDAGCGEGFYARSLAIFRARESRWLPPARRTKRRAALRFWWPISRAFPCARAPPQRCWMFSLPRITPNSRACSLRAGCF